MQVAGVANTRQHLAVLDRDAIDHGGPRRLRRPDEHRDANLGAQGHRVGRRRRLIRELLDEQAKRLFDVTGRAGVDADADVARRAAGELDQLGKERHVGRRVQRHLAMLVFGPADERDFESQRQLAGIAQRDERAGRRRREVDLRRRDGEVGRGGGVRRKQQRHDGDGDEVKSHDLGPLRNSPSPRRYRCSCRRWRLVPEPRVRRR